MLDEDIRFPVGSIWETNFGLGLGVLTSATNVRCAGSHSTGNFLFWSEVICVVVWHYYDYDFDLSILLCQIAHFCWTLLWKIMGLIITVVHTLVQLLNQISWEIANRMSLERQKEGLHDYFYNCVLVICICFYRNSRVSQGQFFTPRWENYTILYISQCVVKWRL